MADRDELRSHLFGEVTLERFANHYAWDDSRCFLVLVGEDLVWSALPQAHWRRPDFYWAERGAAHDVV